MSGAHVYATSLPELVQALEARGERATMRGNSTLLFGTIDGIESAMQVVWRADVGAVHFVEVLPYVIGPERTADLLRFLADANADLAVPAFQLRKQPVGSKVAFSTVAFLDHESRLSTRAAGELIKTVRFAVRDAHAPLRALTEAAAPTLPSSGDPQVFSTAIDTGQQKLDKLDCDPVEVSLSADEVAAIVKACERDLPRFAGRVAEAEVTNVAAPYFKRVRVLKLESQVPFPAQTAYVAWTASGPSVLTGNPTVVTAMCADERPAVINDFDLAVHFAVDAMYWASASVFNEVRVNTADDIPWRRAGEDDTTREAELRKTVGPQLRPAGVAKLDDGLRVTMWVASESKLRFRVADIRRDVVAVSETAVADLPTFPGRMWGERDGQFVPVG